MKKHIRILSLILCVVLMFGLLTGCKSLDTRKQNQAFWNNKERTEVLLNGSIYKMLRECEYFSPDITSGLGTFVTEKDVPVLLATNIAAGVVYSISNDKEIIHTCGYWFARSDAFEKYQKMIENYSLDHIASYKGYKNANGQYEEKLTLCSDEDSKFLSEAADTAVKDKPLDDENGCYYMDIFHADKTLSFNKYSGCLWYYIGLNKVQLVIEDEYYTVDDRYVDGLKKIIQSYTEYKFNSNFAIEN